MTEVVTVDDLQTQLEEKSGISKPKQGRIIFGGKSLSPDTVLADAGVPDDGSAKLNIVPSTSTKKKKTKKTAAAKTLSKAEAAASSSTASGDGAKSPMEEYLKNSGVDTDQLNDMMKNFGGGDGGGMEETMKNLAESMKNPMIQDMLTDPEKLEQMRQTILTNPMLKSMMGGLPGLDQLLNDKDAFQQAMKASADMYKNMDGDDLMKSMMNGAEAAKGMFDGTLPDSAATAGLDELDEDD